MHQIDPRNISELVASLRNANEKYTCDGREGSIEVLQAFIVFCEGSPDLHAALSPLVAMLSALSDLRLGQVNSIVCPELYGNRPPEEGYRVAIKAVAVTCADKLRHSGMNRQEADRLVADLPPLKWSSLKYDFRMEDEIDGKEEAYG